MICSRLVRRVVGCLAAMLCLASATAASAQWTEVGADKSGRLARWGAAAGKFAPDYAVGISSMAFDSQGTLYLASEKFPSLIVLGEKAPAKVLPLAGRPTFVDIEAMSIFRNADGDDLYLCDEDPEDADGKLFLYHYKAGKPELLEKISIDPKEFGMNPDPVPGFGSPTDNRSFEGLVVTKTRLDGATSSEPGPYFYLLDEFDRASDGDEAVVYCAVQRGSKLVRVGKRFRFGMGMDLQKRPYRLCELFESKGTLYALMTNYGSYRVMKFEPGMNALSLVCDFSKALDPNLSSNFEAVAVAPDGRLFLSADNEMFDKTQLQPGGPTQVSPNGKKIQSTPLLVLPVKR